MNGRIAVLVSGFGTNLQALVEDPVIAPRIVVVVSDRPGVGALDKAAAAGIEALVLRPTDFPDRDAYSDVVRDALLERSVDVVANAGYMRILGPSFAERPSRADGSTCTPPFCRPFPVPTASATRSTGG